MRLTRKVFNWYVNRLYLNESFPAEIETTIGFIVSVVLWVGYLNQYSPPLSPQAEYVHLMSILAPLAFCFSMAQGMLLYLVIVVSGAAPRPIIKQISVVDIFELALTVFITGFRYLGHLYLVFGFCFVVLVPLLPIFSILNYFYPVPDPLFRKVVIIFFATVTVLSLFWIANAIEYSTHVSANKALILSCALWIVFTGTTILLRLFYHTLLAT